MNQFTAVVGKRETIKVTRKWVCGSTSTFSHIIEHTSRRRNLVGGNSYGSIPKF